MRKIQFKKQSTLLVSILFHFMAFSQTGDNYILFQSKDYHFPYQFSEPARTWELPSKLIEISGLSYLDSTRMACVQDEKGNIYIFNLLSGEIEQKINFGKDDDYEGIEIIGKDAWVLKGNGTLYQVTDYLKKAVPNVKKHATILTHKNNAEGLCYDPTNNKLLIACKGHPFVDNKPGKGYKAVYRFDLETNLIEPDPIYLIDMDTIRYYKNYNTMTRVGVDLLAYLDPSKGDISFQPSAIAIQPNTRDIYILASVGHLLIVLDPSGAILSMIKMRTKYFPKPEGICFGPDGILYISNEGDGGKGIILKFEFLKQ